MPYQQQQTPPQQHQGLPQQHQAQPQQQQSLPPTQRVSSSGSLSFSEQIAALAAKKNATPSTATPTNSIVPSVTPSNTPPIERKEVSPPPVTLENELLAKLKRRQESKPPPDPVVSNIPVPDPKPQETTPVTEPPKEATPPTVPRPTTVSNQQSISSSVNPPGPLVCLHVHNVHVCIGCLFIIAIKCINCMYELVIYTLALLIAFEWLVKCLKTNMNCTYKYKYMLVQKCSLYNIHVVMYMLLFD